MTRRQLLANLDSEELTLWRAFDRVDPFGQDRADLRAGIIAANYSNWKKSGNCDRFVPADFMFEYGRVNKIEEQAPEDVEAAIDAAMTSLLQG